MTYRSGKLNQDADGLSRRPQPGQTKEMFRDVVKAVCNAALVSKSAMPLVESLVVSDAASLEALADQKVSAS